MFVEVVTRRGALSRSADEERALDRRRERDQISSDGALRERTGPRNLVSFRTQCLPRGAQATWGGIAIVPIEDQERAAIAAAAVPVPSAPVLSRQLSGMGLRFLSLRNLREFNAKNQRGQTPLILGLRRVASEKSGQETANADRMAGQNQMSTVVFLPILPILSVLLCCSVGA